MDQIRIFEDQENRRPPPRAKTTAQGNGGNQQKRAVLGLVDQNKLEKPAAVAKTRTVLGPSKTTQQSNNENWGNNQKDGTSKSLKSIVNPIVPVAQFEAFNVRDKEAERARIDAKLRARCTSNIYTGSAQDRFVTKREVAEMQRKGLLSPKYPARRDSPMSLENYLDFKENRQGTIVTEDNMFFTAEEYQVDIFNYLREKELQNRPKSGYMRKQPDVTASMRTILVDWLVEVAEEYKLETETLYIAVNYVDRFLSYMSVVRAKLQLVGTTAMFLAAKYEEIYPPDISEFVYITDDTYTKRQMFRMEHLIVKVLGFDLSVPTPLAFLTAICTMNKIEEKPKLLAMYICELSLLEGEPYLEFLPSQLAASAVILAQLTLGNIAWSDSFGENIQYNLQDLKRCLEFLYSGYVQAPTHPQHAIQDKYKVQKYLHVSQNPAPAMERFNQFVETGIAPLLEENL